MKIFFSLLSVWVLGAASLLGGVSFEFHDREGILEEDKELQAILREEGAWISEQLECSEDVVLDVMVLESPSKYSIHHDKAIRHLTHTKQLPFLRYWDANGFFDKVHGRDHDPDVYARLHINRKKSDEVTPEAIRRELLSMLGITIEEEKRKALARIYHEEVPQYAREKISFSDYIKHCYRGYAFITKNVFFGRIDQYLFSKGKGPFMNYLAELRPFSEESWTFQGYYSWHGLENSPKVAFIDGRLEIVERTAVGDCLSLEETAILMDLGYEVRNLASEKILERVMKYLDSEDIN